MRRKLLSHRSKKKPTNNDKSQTFHGLADADGLESLLTFEESQVQRLIMRASIYRYRHMIYFRVNLDGPTLKAIQSLMRKGKCKDAVTLLKDKDVWVPDEFQASWNLIPDTRLDPYVRYTRR